MNILPLQECQGLGISWNTSTVLVRGRVSVRLDRHFCCMDRELDVEEEIVRATYVAQKYAKHCYPVCASQRGQLVLSICQFVSPVKKF